MKITLILSAAAATLALSALSPASARPFAPSMTCDAAAGLVAGQGAVVLSTSPTTYDRYVRGYGFCAHGEYLERAFVQTRDAPACLIGYTCTTREPYPIFGRRGF